MTTGIRVLLSGCVTLLVVIVIALIEGILYRRNNPDPFRIETEKGSAPQAAGTTAEAVTEKAP